MCQSIFNYSRDPPCTRLYHYLMVIYIYIYCVLGIYIYIYTQSRNMFFQQSQSPIKRNRYRTIFYFHFSSIFSQHFHVSLLSYSGLKPFYYPLVHSRARLLSQNDRPATFISKGLVNIFRGVRIDFLGAPRVNILPWKYNITSSPSRRVVKSCI